MVMVGQEKRLAAPVTTTRRERRAVKLCVAVLVIASIAVAVLYAAQRPSGGHCVTVTSASYTGGIINEQCGAQAAAWCAGAFAAGPGDVFARAVRIQCLRAGYLQPARRQ